MMMRERADDFADHPGYFRRGRNQRRNEDDQNGVEVGFVVERFQAGAVLLGAAVGGHINRVVDRRGGRQRLSQRLFRRFAERGNFQPGGFGGVNGQDGGASGVGQNADSAASGDGLRGEQPRDREEFHQGVDTDDACLGEERVGGAV